MGDERRGAGGSKGANKGRGGGRRGITLRGRREKMSEGEMGVDLYMGVEG